MGARVPAVGRYVKTTSLDLMTSIESTRGERFPRGPRTTFLMAVVAGFPRSTKVTQMEGTANGSMSDCCFWCVPHDTFK